MHECFFRDVVIIGAGPAGSVAAAILKNEGVDVLVLEEKHFPRFSIGESLLPYCMTHIEYAGMLDAVNGAGFQRKDGAVFWWREQQCVFDFTKKFGVGPSTTFEVKRAEFDKLLADEAAKSGADVCYGHRVVAADFSGEPRLEVITDEDREYGVRCRFVLDASGFGRVLPRLLNMGRPSGFPVRSSVFTHIKDNIQDVHYDRNKILIIVHPQDKSVWYWLIPFSDGRASLGVVAEPGRLNGSGDNPTDILKSMVSQMPKLAALLANAVYDTGVRQITGYSSNVSSLWGNGFALLGNAGEFLDPVFSSGVTVALKSARLAAPLVAKQLRGEAVDWQQEYACPLKAGVDTFRAFVDAWYGGGFQDVIFASNQSAEIRAMICAVLAGYAWNSENPYVAQPKRRLNALVEVCRAQS